MADATHLMPLAADALGVPPEATAHDRRTAFLWRLDEEGYAPSAEALESAALLGIVPQEGELSPALEAKFERLFVERLDQFAGDYWDIEPDARRAEWQALDGLARPMPKHHARLRELSAGLELKLPADPDEIFGPVLRCLETAYILPSARRARRLEEIQQQEG